MEQATATDGILAIGPRDALGEILRKGAQDVLAPSIERASSPGRSTIEGSQTSRPGRAQLIVCAGVSCKVAVPQCKVSCPATATIVLLLAFSPRWMPVL